MIYVMNPKYLGLLMIVMGILLVGYSLQYNYVHQQSISDLPVCSLRILSYYNNIEVKPGQVFHQRITIGAPQCTNSSTHDYVLRIIDPSGKTIKEWKGYLSTLEYRIFDIDIKAPNDSNTYKYIIHLDDKTMNTRDEKTFIVNVKAQGINLAPETLGIALIFIGYILMKMRVR